MSVSKLLESATKLLANECKVTSELYRTTSSESLPNDGKKPNQPKRQLFPKCDYGRNISIKHASDAFKLALSRSGIHKSLLEGWSFWENWWIL